MQDGRPLKKPLSLMTNSFDFAELMRVKCKEETHNHRALQGPDTAWSATCLTAFANAVLRNFGTANRISSQGIFLNYPTESKPALPLLRVRRKQSTTELLPFRSRGRSSQL
jgi:hypothetical protein